MLACVARWREQESGGGDIGPRAVEGERGLGSKRV